jgi:hypothetical protein
MPFASSFPRCIIPAWSPEGCSMYKFGHFSVCLLVRPSGDESINQRITNLLPTVRHCSWPIESTIFSGLKGLFRSSLFVNGCRCWAQIWGQEQPDILVCFGYRYGSRSNLQVHKAVSTCTASTLTRW